VGVENIRFVMTRFLFFLLFVPGPYFSTGFSVALQVM
jgi:hypothetical protein